MNAIGIDVSKGKSTVAVLRPFREVVAQPFEIIHCDSDFSKLVAFIKQLPGESKVVMEATGTYHEPLARYLHNNGIFVSVVNAILIHDYSGNTLRKAKTDKKDALKIASYTLDRWTELREYTPAEDLRFTLKILNRQYIQNTKIQTMQKNNLISLLYIRIYIYIQIVNHLLNKIHFLTFGLFNSLLLVLIFLLFQPLTLNIK